MISQQALAQSLFNNDIRYVVINKTIDGFSIYLNKPAPEDVTFSWIALAVKGAKTFTMLSQPKPQTENQPISDIAPTPIVSNLTSTTSITEIPAVLSATTSTEPDANASGTLEQEPASGDATTTVSSNDTAPIVSPEADQNPVSDDTQAQSTDDSGGQ